MPELVAFPPWPASIHAPARGATGHVQDFGDDRHCFNPRSRTGSDRLLTRLTTTPPKLQSTLPHGERLPASASAAVQFAASIHAPARGATITMPPLPSGQALQSTLPHGERRGSSVKPPSHLLLQSTLPHGERQRFAPSSRRCCAASIHAPARGATCDGSERGADDNLLQSTLPHGERPVLGAIASIPRRFNPRSRTGSDVSAAR